MHLSLQEGSTLGAIRLANRNRRGIAYKIPRLRLSRYFKVLENERNEAMENKKPPQDTYLDKACVYILLGKDEEGGREGIGYIGESEDVTSRLLTHNTKKEFWNEVIILCRTDDDFNKGSILYVEGQLIDLAKQCDRYTLENTDRASNEKPLNADDKSVADDFIDDIKMLVEMLGCKIFTPKRESANTQPGSQVEGADGIPIFSIRGGAAKGQPTNDGFVVFEGSEIAATEDPKCPQVVKRQRASMLEDGSIGADGKLTRDYLFGTPTRASIVVLGKPGSGTQTWSIPQESGGWKSLGDWRAEQEATDTPSEQSEQENDDAESQS